MVWTRRHVLALLLVAVFAAAGAALPYLIRKKTDAPKPPTEPAATKTRTLVDPQRRFTIDIPFNWEVMSEYFVKQRLKPLTEKAAKGRLSPYERYRLDYLKRMDEKRGTLIRCMARRRSRSLRCQVSSLTMPESGNISTVSKKSLSSKLQRISVPRFSSIRFR